MVRIKRAPFDPLTMVFGWDLSSVKLAVYYRRLDGWEVGHRTWTLTDRFIEEVSCKYAMRVVKRFQKRWAGEPCRAWVEAPVVAGARNIQTTIKQAMVNGAVLAALTDEGVNVVSTSPGTWKKSVIGKGSVGKEEVRQFVDKKWPTAAEKLRSENGLVVDQDLYDAYCLCQHGTNYLTGHFVED